MGAAALINSLVASGFAGRVYCGVRGPLPSWASSSSTDGNGTSVRPSAEVEVLLIDAETSMHLTNYKPSFMLRVLELEPEASGVVYLDPDVVVKCPWGFVEDWCRLGIALVADVSWHLPRSSPVRRRWRELCRTFGFELPDAPLDLYCNGGFLGVARGDATMLDTWASLIDQLRRSGIDDQTLFEGIRTAPIMGLDQDAMNMAAMAHAARVSQMGPEAMDFASGGQVFSHATGKPKPWEKRFLLRSLRGFPPTKADLAFLGACDGPLQPMPSGAVRRRRLAAKAGRVVGTVFRRVDA